MTMRMYPKLKTVGKTKIIFQECCYLRTTWVKTDSEGPQRKKQTCKLSFTIV